MNVDDALPLWIYTFPKVPSLGETYLWISQVLLSLNMPDYLS